MKTRATIREITDGDFINQYGFEPPHELTGLIMTDHEGDVLCIGGVFADEVLISFSRITEKGRRYPANTVEMAKAMRLVLGSFNKNIYAVASKSEKNPGGFMEFIGFEFSANIDGDDYYVWRNSDG